MRKMVGLGGLVVVLLLAAVIGWLVARGGSTTETSGGDEAVAPPTSSPRVAERGGAAVEGSAVGSEDPLADARRAERNALRQRILDAQRARARAAAEREAGSTGGSGPSPRRSPELGATGDGDGDDDDGGPATGGLTDRTGNHDHFVEVLNEDLMPLVDECYALALDEQPGLAGMLVMDLEMIGEPELGGVVESIEPAPTNALTDPGLIECVRESILSTTLPPPSEGGRDALSLSLRLEPDAEAEAEG